MALGSGYWRVTIKPHTVGGRYEIPGTETETGAASKVAAIKKIIRHVHIKAKVPPWKPYLRETVPFTSAQEFVPLSQEQRLKAEGKI